MAPMTLKRYRRGGWKQVVARSVNRALADLEGLASLPAVGGGVQLVAGVPVPAAPLAILTATRFFWLQLDAPVTPSAEPYYTDWHEVVDNGDGTFSAKVDGLVSTAGSAALPAHEAHDREAPAGAVAPAWTTADDPPAVTFLWTPVTDEEIADSLAAALANSATVAVVYDDAAGTFTWSVVPGSIGPTQLANTTVAAGTYSRATVTVDAQGRVTAASSNAGGVPDANYGDVTVSGGGSSWQLNANVVGPAELISTAVTPGSYTNASLTVDADGRLTAASSGAVPTVATVTWGADQTDYALAAGVEFLLVDLTADVTLNSMTGGADARRVYIVNTSNTYRLRIKHRHSSGSNRFNLPRFEDRLVLDFNEGAGFVYSTGVSGGPFWQCLDEGNALADMKSQTWTGGSVTDYVLPPGLEGLYVTLTADTDLHSVLHGLANASDSLQGRSLYVVNLSAFTLTLKHNSGAATPGFAFLLPDAVDLALTQYQGAHLLFANTSTGNWRCVGAAKPGSGTGGTMNITGLSPASPAFADEVPAYNTTAAANRKTTRRKVAGLARDWCGGRLTLTGGDPDPSADATAANNIILLPFVSDVVYLWDGADWVPTLIGGVAIVDLASPTVNTSKGYDVFGYYDAGDVRLETLAWASTTARATAVTWQDGRLCKSGDKSRLLLGSFLPTSTTTTEDSALKRYLSNLYNPVSRDLLRYESASSWGGDGTDTWRKWNNSASNRVEWFSCMNWHEVNVDFLGFASSTSGVPYMALGLDSTTAPTGRYGFTPLAGGTITAILRRKAGIGYHYCQALEKAGGGITFYGTSGGTIQTGLEGWVMA
jgi:hypothetical protein